MCKKAWKDNTRIMVAVFPKNNKRNENKMTALPDYSDFIGAISTH